MRIDLPYCGFKNCIHCFDGNCTKPSEQGKCEYWYLLHEEPEIIKCEDCKYRGETPIADGRYWCDIHYAFMYYCSDAERKEE